MRTVASLFLAWLCCLAVLALTGCDVYPQNSSDEEKEPHFLEGKSRVNTLDYEGAIECFEKALQANPQSASAHFELAWLFDQKEDDPAAAIYHYQNYLKLRPNPGNQDTVKQRILACKQELARSVSLGPVTEKVQRDLDQLTQNNKRLNDDNKKLHDDLDKWIAYAAWLQSLTNRAAPPARGATAASAGASALLSNESSSTPNIVRAAATAANSTRSYTIKPGDTPSAIARKCGVRLEALMAANPGLDARRLRVGQALTVPVL